MLKGFTSLKRIKKRLGTLIQGFESVIKVSKQMLEVLFPFSKERKSQNELPHRLLPLILSLLDLKNDH